MNPMELKHYERLKQIRLLCSEGQKELGFPNHYFLAYNSIEESCCVCFRSLEIDIGYRIIKEKEQLNKLHTGTQ